MLPCGGWRKTFVRVAAGETSVDLDLVFTTSLGIPLDAANVQRAFRRVAAVAGLDAADWTPPELRHSFVSPLSSHRPVDRGHLAPGRPRQHACHPDCLPQGNWLP